MNTINHWPLYLYAHIYLALVVALVLFHIWTISAAKCCPFDFCFTVVNFFEILNYLARLVFIILLLVAWHKNNSSPYLPEIFESEPEETPSITGRRSLTDLKIDDAADCSDYVGNMVLKDFISGI